MFSLREVEMEYWRRICNLTRLSTVRNDEIRKRAGLALEIRESIEMKQLKWLGYMYVYDIK